MDTTLDSIYVSCQIYFVQHAEADTGFPERGDVGCRGYGYFILGFPV